MHCAVRTLRAPAPVWRQTAAWLEVLAECAVAETLSLREMQSIAGKMQRIIMTLPPGAAFLLVPLFALGRGGGAWAIPPLTGGAAARDATSGSGEAQLGGLKRLSSPLCSTAKTSGCPTLRATAITYVLYAVRPP